MCFLLMATNEPPTGVGTEKNWFCCVYISILVLEIVEVEPARGHPKHQCLPVETQMDNAMPE